MFQNFSKQHTGSLEAKPSIWWNTGRGTRKCAACTHWNPSVGKALSQPTGGLTSFPKDPLAAGRNPEHRRNCWGKDWKTSSKYSRNMYECMTKYYIHIVYSANTHFESSMQTLDHGMFKWYIAQTQCLKLFSKNGTVIQRYLISIHLPGTCSKTLLTNLGTFRWSGRFKVIRMRAIVLKATTLNAQGTQIHEQTSPLQWPGEIEAKHPGISLRNSPTSME